MPERAPPPARGELGCPLGALPDGEGCADVGPVSVGAYLGCVEAGACPRDDVFADPWEAMEASSEQADAYCGWRSGQLLQSGADGFRCRYPTGRAAARFGWDRPWCLGYARGRGYACLGYGLENESGEARGTSDVAVLEAFLERAGALAPDEEGYAVHWDGGQRVVFVGEGDPAPIELTDVEADGSGRRRVRRERSLGDALAEVGRRGYRAAGMRARMLVPGAWARVGDAWVRVAPHYRSGGGISEHLGHSVEVSCERSAREPLERREGTIPGAAWAFWAEGASDFVVGTVEWSGGEGTVYLHTGYTLHHSACPRRARWAEPGSNRRPTVCKTGALPAELPARGGGF